jgi:Pyruvate/2-oxoacid:ferredoxin oxidoreductase gamma subunit
MLGAFAAITDWITVNAIFEAILEFWPGDQGKRNALVAKTAYERTTIV